MAVAETNGGADPRVRSIEAVLQQYRSQHSQAEIAVRIQNPVSLRIRIIDPDFNRLNRSAREDAVWPILQQLPDEVFLDISMLLLLTPGESQASLANIEFEQPGPSLL